jgi:hypothetical protein
MGTGATGKGTGVTKAGGGGANAAMGGGSTGRGTGRGTGIIAAGAGICIGRGVGIEATTAGVEAEKVGTAEGPKGPTMVCGALGVGAPTEEELACRSVFIFTTWDMEDW